MPTRFSKGDVIIGKEYTYPDGALRVADVRPDGTIEVAPEGGGFVMTFSPESQVKNRMRKVTPEEMEPKYRKSFFSMDCLPEDPSGWLPGWTAGDRWNGWACPMFDREAADLFCTLTERDPGMYQTRYDAKADAYVSTNQDGEVEDRAEGCDIEVAGRKIRVYDIGSHSWCWIEDPKRGKRDDEEEG